MTLSERLTDLATCLCAQIETDGSPPTCFCGVIPGDAAVGDYAGNCNDRCGMAWVRLVALYPMQGLGFPDQSAGNCSTEIGALVEMGILRCISVGDQRNPVPPPAELLRAAEQQAVDAMTMRRALVCCDAFSAKDFILGSYTPMGPLGQLVGGNWQMTVI